MQGRPEHPIVVLPSSLESPEVWGDDTLMHQYAAQIVVAFFGA